MQLSKSVNPVLVIIWIMIFAVFVFAQEESVFKTPESGESFPNYLPPAEAEPVGDEINTGYLIAYGELMPRPYTVTFSNDTVWINEYAYEPSIPDPNPPPPKDYGFSALQKEQIDLSTEIGIKIRTLKEVDIDNERVKEIILKDYGNHPFITDLEFSDDLRQLSVTFKDLVGAMTYHIYKRQPSTPRFTPEQIIDNRKSNVDRIRKKLINGEMFVISYQGTTTLSSERTKQVIEIVQQVTGGELTPEEGKERLNNLIRHLVKLGIIIDHIDSWSWVTK